MDLEKPPNAEPLYANPLAVKLLKGIHQWGMSIDLNSVCWLLGLHVGLPKRKQRADCGQAASAEEP
jgi:hypothetical protein